MELVPGQRYISGRRSSPSGYYGPSVEKSTCLASSVRMVGTLFQLRSAELCLSQGPRGNAKEHTVYTPCREMRHTDGVLERLAPEPHRTRNPRLER